MTAKQPKVAKEVAEADFDRMCEKFRVDLDPANMTPDEAKDLGELRKMIVRDMMTGALIVSPEGLPTFHPTSGKAVTFNPPTGATLMALETHAPQKAIANQLAAMTDMCEGKAGDFAKMPARDVQICSRLAKLFLADQ